MNRPDRMPAHLTIALLLVGLIASASPGPVAAERNGPAAPASSVELVVQSGHTAEIRALAYAPNGRYLASAGKDSTIKIWSPGGTLIRSIATGFWVNDLAISSDSRAILAGGFQGQVALWSVDGELLRRFAPMRAIVLSVALSPDSRRAAAGDTYGNASIYRVEDGESLPLHLEGKKYGVHDLLFTPDGARLLAGYGDGKLRFWSAEGRLLKTVAAHAYSLRSVALSPDGTRIATAGVLGTSQSERGKEAEKIRTRLWDLDGKLLGEFRSHSTQSLHFTADGARLVSGGMFDNAVRVYTTAGQQVNMFPVGRSSVTSPYRIALSPDGERIATADTSIHPPGMKLWRASGEFERSFQRLSGSMTDVAMSPDGSTFVTTSQDNRVRLWLTTGRLLASLTGHKEFPWAVAYAPNGNFFVSGAEEIVVWGRVGQKLGTLPGHRNGINALAFTPDSRLLFSGGGDGHVQIVDFKARSVKRLKVHDGRVYAIAVHPSGKRFATGSSREHVRVWDLDGNLQGEHKFSDKSLAPVGAAYALAFSPDGEHLVAATANRSRSVQIFDSKARLLGSLQTPNAYMNGDVAISPSGRLLAATVNTGIAVWDWQTRKLVRVLKGSNGNVAAIAFTPDERHLVAVANDSTTRMWRLDTRYAVTMLARDNDWIAYSDDGHFDASHYGGELVAVVRGLDTYGVDQFAIGRNRPDIMLRRLGLGSAEFIEHLELQYQKRLLRSRIHGDPEQVEFEAPEVRLTNVRRDGKHVHLEAEARDRAYVLQSYQVFVNEVPLFSGLGKPLSGQEATIRERVELGQGDNKVEITAYNSRGVEAYRSQWSGTYRGNTKGDLYYIGFGVSRYRNPALNLQFAHKDALDLGDLMQRYRGAYRRVVVKTYIDDQVTPENVAKAKELLRDATVDDTVVLFVAGHGAYDLSKEATYYYATHNVDVGNLAGTAVSFDQLESLLAGIAPRKKLMLLDTCESGEMDPVTRAEIEAKMGDDLKVRTSSALRRDDANRTRRVYLYDRDRYIYNDLTRRTGAVVFSASHAGELSFESPAIENGFFTRGVIDALTSANADTNRDGVVSVHELQAFVSLTVTLKTGGLQRPTVDRDNIYQRFGFPAAR